MRQETLPKDLSSTLSFSITSRSHKTFALRDCRLEKFELRWTRRPLFTGTICLIRVLLPNHNPLIVLDCPRLAECLQGTRYTLRNKKF